MNIPYINKKITIGNSKEDAKILIEYFKENKKPLYPNQMMMMGMEFPRFRKFDEDVCIIEGEYFPITMCYIED